MLFIFFTEGSSENAHWTNLYLKQTVCPLNYGKWILLEIGLDQGHEELEDNQMMLI